MDYLQISCYIECWLKNRKYWLKKFKKGEKYCLTEFISYIKKKTCNVNKYLLVINIKFIKKPKMLVFERDFFKVVSIFNKRKKIDYFQPIWTKDTCE